MSSTTTRSERIRSLLQAGLAQAQVQVIDDSHLHAGHEGARDGRGHYRVHVISPAFAGKRILQRHQLVYGVLEDMMSTDIHALNIVAQTPEEAAAQTRTK